MPTKPLPEEPLKRAKAAQSAFVRYYLVTYNVLSTLGWSYVFITASMHLLGLTDLSRVTSTTASPTATSTLMRLVGSIPYFKSSVPYSAQVHSRLPPSFIPLLNRARTTFTAVGTQTALVQSFALLEVVHSVLGWVRSSVLTTGMQVTSRLILVWAIVEQYESARINPIYASMVLAWSVTEIIRYSFYASNLLKYEPRWLLWLRYNTFFVLYPVGAGSEAALIFSTLPSSAPSLSGSSWTTKAWGPWDYVRATLFLIWWPALYVLFSHMMQQRRKVLGKSTGSKRKTL